MNVRDIMRTDVVTANPDLSIRELTRLLSEHGISGVPVVTEAGEVLGVVSASDVIRVTAEAAVTPVSGMRWVPMGGPVEAGETEDDAAEPWSDYFLPEDAPETSWDWGAGVAEGETGQLTVSDLMTPVTFTVDSGASLQELADFLVRGKIHRALVLDDGRLQGIVTAMDVMEVVARGEV